MIRASVALLLATAAPACAQTSSDNATLTAIGGIRVGHYTLSARPTGCTVILAEGALGGVSQRGAAPGTRDTDLLDPIHDADRIDAIVLSGGSAFGLDATNGVMRWLDERRSRRSRLTDGESVPVVPAAVLIDLWVGGKPAIRPDADCGYRAAGAASAARVVEGSLGAGAGATVGKLAGLDRAMKGGIGSAAIILPNGLRVAALAAVNALGDIVDPQTGAVVAGARDDHGSPIDVRRLLRAGVSPRRTQIAENTTLVVVATNARLTKSEVNRVAAMADAGIGRTVTPAHTIADGDTVFALATRQWGGQADVTIVGALAAEVVGDAIVRAVREATGVAGVPAARDLK